MKRMCWLSYFIPIIITANKDNIESIIFITKNRKAFADPYTEDNNLILKNLSKEYNFQIKDIKKIENYKGKVYCIEGDIACSHRDSDNSYKYLNKEHYIICLRADFSMPIIYDIYNNYVNEIIYISKYYCIDFINPKNRFLGSPKYDYINFDKEEIYNKYKLDKTKKYILIFFPKNRNRPNTYYPSKNKMLEIYKICKSLDYEILIKTRKQDRIEDKNLKDKYYFEEGNHYPNVVLELLSISNLAIIFSSSAVEECIYMKVPIIDIKIDDISRLKFLNNIYIYIEININNQDLFNKLKDYIKLLKKNDIIFNNIINKYLFSNNCSKNII